MHNLAVGAVYDRAVFAVEWDERAVIDRAYSRKWAANFLLCKATKKGRGETSFEVSPSWGVEGKMDFMKAGASCSGITLAVPGQSPSWRLSDRSNAGAVTQS